ncbi:MAG: CHASE2 domain-containing protein [Opitutales bacterium]
MRLLRKFDDLRPLFEFLRRWRTLAVLGFSILVLGSVWLLRETTPFQTGEGRMLDWRFFLRGPEPARDDIVIVGVMNTSLGYADDLDEATLERTPILRRLSNWPWNREAFAELTYQLIDDGARLIVYDIVFKQEVRDTSEYSMQRYASEFLRYFGAEAEPVKASIERFMNFYEGKLGWGDDLFADVLLEEGERVVLNYIWAGEGNALGQSRASVTFPHPRFVDSLDADQLGYAMIELDADGVSRRLALGRHHLLIGQPDAVLPPDRKPDRFALSLVAARRSGLDFAEPSVREKLIINYAGPRESFPVVPIEDVLESDNASGRAFLTRSNFFRDKIVIVGPVAEIFKDDKTTPYGVMSGPEVHANILASILDESFIRRAPLSWRNAALAALTLLPGLICWGVGRVLLKLLLVLAVGLGYVFFSQLIFLNEGWHLPMFAPLIGFGLAGSFALAYDFVLEQYERRRVRGVLDRYVTENVAELVLANRDDFARLLRGRRQNVAVMFSDIRGFTALSEKTDPERLVAQLNEYFRGMVDAILVEGGTLQKFVGDAILAVWGDTHSHGEAEDCRRCVRAALAMRNCIAQLNAEWARDPERQTLRIGVGINYGEAIVGNIGHPMRMEFTVLGDAVNLASRLEGATKVYGQSILVGERTRALTRDAIRFRQLDRIRVVGRTQAINVFTPLDLIEVRPPVWLEDWETGLAHYFARRFGAAERCFRRVSEHFEGEDEPANIFIGRCRMYREQPPTESWTGATVLTVK